MAEQSIDGRLSTIGVTIRYFAAARAASGTAEEILPLTAATTDGGADDRISVGQVLDAAVDRHGPALSRVLARCSFLLDEVAVHGRETPVRAGQLLDVLPPFAGG